MLRPLNLLDLDILHREQRNLQRLKDYKRAYNFTTIPFDTLRSAAATLIVEVVSNAMREHDPQPEIFEYVYRSFIHLDELENLNNDFHLQFMLRFTHYLGFAPQGDCAGSTLRFDMESGCYIDEGALGRYILDTTQSQQLYLIDQTDVDTPLSIPLHRTARQQMLHSLLLYYRLHLEGFRELKSPAIWREVFDGV
jgi:DNA repair protein RecO (recombination protein O)